MCGISQKWKQLNTPDILSAGYSEKTCLSLEIVLFNLATLQFYWGTVARTTTFSHRIVLEVKNIELFCY